MQSPLYIRRRSSTPRRRRFGPGDRLADASGGGGSSSSAEGEQKGTGEDGEEDEEAEEEEEMKRQQEQRVAEERRKIGNFNPVTGLRSGRLAFLILWLTILAVFSVVLLILNIWLVRVLQLTPQGMRSLRIYKDTKSSSHIEPAGVGGAATDDGDEEVVHFSAGRQINLGHVVAHSGRVYGPRDLPLELRGSRVLLGTSEDGENGTRMVFQDGVCRLENTENFQVLNGRSQKTMFSARHPLVNIDSRIKRIASGQIITNKVRSKVGESLVVDGANVNLRGNERLQADARGLNITAQTGIRFRTSKDGSLRIAAKRVFLGHGGVEKSEDGGEYKRAPLPLSSSPALSAAIDAFRVCVCRSPYSARPKLFVVEGSKPCRAPATFCN